uniref:Mediator complex subunit 17 n=1 Tax=Angiostrongylus cantonensis TaxID=6313 RepID=A0A0K0CWP1_ANGCA
LVFMCFRPPSFSDNVGKLARQVDWKKLIGSDAVYDNPNSLINETDDEEVQNIVEERVVPEAGPWHNVAKFLHESLQQLNVLLDNLAIMRATDYMKPLTVLDPIHAESGPMLAETAAVSKATQWVWKRKALLEAMSVLELAQRFRNVEVEDEVHQQKSQFFSELTKMREYWRVRKTGDHIYGDLGYHIFGSKYNPRELFDISRVSFPPGTSFDSNVSVLQVTVPRDLTRRSTLSVSIVKDDHMNRDLFASLDDHQFEYMKVDSNKIESIQWTNALTWAQETLICKDIFNTLCSDAVQMRNRLSTIRDGVLLVSLYNDYLLRVELKYHPFKEGDLPEEGCPYLNRALREMMVAQECTRWMRPQMFISLPLTNLSEALDARGPRAFTAREIESRAYRPQFLLEKLIIIASHYSLVRMTRDTLEEFMSTTRDPQVYSCCTYCLVVELVHQCSHVNLLVEFYLMGL